MKRSMLIMAVLAMTTLSLFGYTSNQITWKDNAPDGNLANYLNWSGVPGGTTDINYNMADDTGYWGMFSSGSVTRNLYISAAFTFDRLYFQGSNSKYNIDLGGNTLTLRGAATYELTTNVNYKPQKIFVTNGDIALPKTRREFRIHVLHDGMSICYSIQFGSQLMQPSADGCHFGETTRIGGV